MGKISLRIVIEGGDDGVKVARKLGDAFEQVDAKAKSAARSAAAITDKDVFARSAQVSKQFLNELINSGGMRQYQEVLRNFAPDFQKIHEQIKQGSFNQEDYNRRMDAMPPLLQKAMGDVSALGKNIKGLGEEADNTGDSLQTMLIKAELAGRVIDVATEKVTEAWTEYKNFTKEIGSLNTILDNESNLSKFRDAILALPPALGTATELTKGLKLAIGSDIKEEDALGFLEKSAVAAKAGVAGLTETIDAGTTILASYKLQAKDIETVYDKMFQTVKDGKIEMPELARSIGQVASISALAGVTLDEMMAAIATATLTGRPSESIEGLRTALSNIIKPSEDAKDLAQQLGFEFSAAALKSQGLAQFLQTVSEKTGNSADKLAILFGDVQGFNIISKIAGQNADQFAKRLENMGNTAGNTRTAFAKQQDSLGVEFENFGNRLLKGLLSILQTSEPVLKLILGTLNTLLPIIIAVSVAAVGLKVAWMLMNTQFFATAAAAIPNALAGLKLVWGTMTSLTAATYSFGTALGVAMGWLTIIGVVVGVAVYAYSNMETAIDRANKVTLDAITANVQSLQTYKSLATEAQAVAAAQEGSTERHEKLNAVLGKLDPVTKAYIQNLVDEKTQVKVLSDEISKNLEVQKALLEAKLRTAAAGFFESSQKIEAENKQITENQRAITELTQANLDYSRQLSSLPLGSQSWQGLTQQISNNKMAIDSLVGSNIKAGDELKNLNVSLIENAVKFAQAAVGMGMTNDQLTELLTKSGYTKTQIELINNAANQGANAQNNFANGMQNSANKVSDLASNLGILNLELKKTISMSQAKIDERIAFIALNAKTAAEARAAMRRSMQPDDELFKDVQNVKTRTELRKAAEDEYNKFINPSSGGGATRPRRAPNPQADFRRENRVITGNAQWDKIVYEMADKYGIDPMLIFAIMSQESSFKRGAVSNKGASGLMQLMPETARGLGVKNIFDPRQNIEAGVKYLRQNLDKFGGSVPLALAAYNAGPGAVQKFNGIPPYSETQNYVKRISERFQKLKGGKFDAGSNFDYERSLAELSDRITKETRDAETTSSIGFNREMKLGTGKTINAWTLNGMMPDEDKLREYNRIQVEMARAAGTLQPTLEQTRKEFAGFSQTQIQREVISPRTLENTLTKQELYLKNTRDGLRLDERKAELDERRSFFAEEVNSRAEDYRLGLQEQLREETVQAALLARRNVAIEASVEFERQRNAQVRETGDIERDLMVLRAQNEDAAFVEQRRTLAVKREQLALEQEIADLQDRMATAGSNDYLIIQAEYLRTILDLRNRELDAVIAINRAELEISQAMEVSNTQIRARVLEHLAGQKTLNEAIADGIIETYEAVADRAGAALDELNEKTKGFLSFIIEPAKAYQRSFLTKITSGLLDLFVPGLGAELGKTSNPIARPIVEEVGKTNQILERIESKLGGNGSIPLPGGGALGIPGLTGGGNLFGAGRGLGGGSFGGGIGSYGTRTGDVVNGVSQIFAGDKGRNDWWSNIKTLFSTKDGGLFAKRKTVFGGESRLGGIMGGIGDLASFAGGMIGGRFGNVLSLAGTGASFGAMFGGVGAAVGAGVGALAGLLMGDPKRKEDKKVNIPNLRKGFVDSLKEFEQLIKDLDGANITASEALKRAEEIRTAISSGFNIDFKSKKYRRIAQSEIQRQLTAIDKKPDGLWERLLAAVARRREGEEFKNRFVATFALGGFTDAAFMNQYGAFKREYGLLRGGIPGKDSIPVLAMQDELFLTKQHQKDIIRGVGYDPFAEHTNIPNYPARKPVKMASGGYLGTSASAGSSESTGPTLNFNGNIVLENIVALPDSKGYLETPDGKRQVIQIVRGHVNETGVTSDGLPRDLEKAKLK